MSKARDLANQVSNLITISTGGSNFVTPQVLSASIANIDLTPYATKAQLSASVANIDVTSSLDSRIYINSASPTSGSNGQIWINTTTASAPTLSVLGSSQFRTPRLGNFSATGGTITTSGPYTIHTFTSLSSFNVLGGSRQVEYLIVSGGGGGANWGGGGGGGGVLTGTVSVTTNSYPIVVGSGGAGAGVNLDYSGFKGASSSAFSISPEGGGFGGATNGGVGGPGGSGGSGGGGGVYNHGGGNSVSGQGNSGGAGNQTSDRYRGGGGGGAGSQGTAPISLSKCGNGGNGILSTISGSNVYYAGGGGGGGVTGSYAAFIEGGTGGLGGGGNGGNSTTDGGNQQLGQDGGVNTGGGGGSGAYGRIGSQGGSGIVILRYLT